MIYNANNEQDFLSFNRNPSRSFQNFDGVQLLTRAFSIVKRTAYGLNLKCEREYSGKEIDFSCWKRDGRPNIFVSYVFKNVSCVFL